MRTEIKINYTAFCVNEWRAIVLDHMTRLKRSVLDRYDCGLTIFANPNPPELRELLEELGVGARIVETQPASWEFPAIRDLITSPNELNLYFHTKGVTRPGQPSAAAWNEYMTHFVVDRCDTCIAQIRCNGCCCAGTSFRQMFPGRRPPWWHYSGNFYWGTGDYLRTLDPEELKVDRYRAEMLLGTGSGRFFSAHDTGMRDLLKEPVLEAELVHPQERVYTLQNGELTQ